VGDFFGPLVVCGFIVSKNVVSKIREMNVKDSKLLKDKEIADIAIKLKTTFPQSFEIISLFPAKYNELYQKFLRQHKKLNELLAWMHSRIIVNLNEKNSFEGVVVDKFAKESTLTNSLKKINTIQVLQKHKAEQDIAVAAASILARFYYLKGMEQPSDKYKMNLPKGASQK
jgi:ribonuclease HIII